MNRPVNPRSLDELRKMSPTQLVDCYLDVSFDKNTGMPEVEMNDGDEESTPFQAFKNYQRSIGVYQLERIEKLWHKVEPFLIPIPSRSE